MVLCRLARSRLPGQVVGFSLPFLLLVGASCYLKRPCPCPVFFRNQGQDEEVRHLRATFLDSRETAGCPRWFSQKLNPPRSSRFPTGMEINHSLSLSLSLSLASLSLSLSFLLLFLLQVSLSLSLHPPIPSVLFSWMSASAVTAARKRGRWTKNTVQVPLRVQTAYQPS